MAEARPRSSADRAVDFESTCGGSTPPGATPACRRSRTRMSTRERVRGQSRGSCVPRQPGAESRARGASARRVRASALPDGRVVARRALREAVRPRRPGPEWSSAEASKHAVCVRQSSPARWSNRYCCWLYWSCGEGDDLSPRRHACPDRRGGGAARDDAQCVAARSGAPRARSSRRGAARCSGRGLSLPFRRGGTFRRRISRPRRTRRS